jgi:hypothetical protein
MIIYKWKINRLDCFPKEEEMIDVVSIVHWSRIAEQEDIQISVYGTMNCPSPSETDFTAYPDLTYEQICNWLDAGLKVVELDASLDSQIENIINPPIVTLPLPWVKDEIIEEKEVISQPKTI